MQRIALLSDVHGNLTALEAVLADIRARGIERVVTLGDHVGKGPRGSEVIARCQQACECCLLGNWDDFLPQRDRWPAADTEALQWWSDELAPGQADWLRSLPFSLDLLVSGRRVRLFHAGSRTVHRKTHFDHDGAQFDDMFASTAATGDGPPPTVVGYGDVHDAFLEVDRGRTLFNVGSVGNPLDDGVPVYVVLEGVPDEPGSAPFGLQFVRVPYDVEAEVAASLRLGNPLHDLYAIELREGRYRGDVRRGLAPRYHRRWASTASSTTATTPGTPGEPAISSASSRARIR